MDESLAFILKSWAAMSVLLVFMGFGFTFIVIKICDFVEKKIDEKKKEK